MCFPFVVSFIFTVYGELNNCITSSLTTEITCTIITQQRSEQKLPMNLLCLGFQLATSSQPAFKNTQIFFYAFVLSFLKPLDSNFNGCS